MLEFISKKQPHRAAEIFQHIFDIRSAAAVYVWDNVYMCDCDFRHLMEKNPLRNGEKFTNMPGP